MREPGRGEVWWGAIPEVGRRPFLVVTRSAAIPVLSGIVCAPVTRSVRNIPSELILGPEDGMPADCAASFDNLRTIPKSSLTEMLCALTLPRRLEMCRALRIAVDC